MIIDVRLREKHREGMTVESFESAIFDLLRTNEINYQNIRIPHNHNFTVQILCNDREEREHIKHILMDDQHTLCIENDGKRYFPKYVNEIEKVQYRAYRKKELWELEE